MKKFGMLKVVALMLALTLTLAGCSFLKSNSGRPDKDPAVVVKEAMMKNSDVKSGDLEILLDVDVKSKDKEKTGFEKFAVEGKMEVAFDVKDTKAPKFSVKVDGKGSQDGKKEESAAGEMRVVGSTLYASLTNLTDFDGTVPMAMVTPYLGKWWSMALPADVMAEFTNEMEVYSKDEKDLTPQEKKMKEIYDGANLFKNAEYDGDEDVKGEATYVYNVELDKDEFKTMIVEMSKAQEQPLSEEDIKMMEENWDKFTFTGKVYVGQKDMAMKKVAGTVVVMDLEGADVNAEISMTFSNAGGEVMVEVPKDATEFDLGSMFGGFGGPVDPSMTIPPTMELDAPVVPAL